MASVSFGIDARQAQQGAADFEAATRRIADGTIAAARAIDDLERKMAALRGQGGINVGDAVGRQAQVTAQATQQLGVAFDQATAKARTVASVTRSLDQEFDALEKEVRDLNRSLGELTREEERQLRTALTALSTLGAENRAFAQSSQFLIRRAQATGQLINQQKILTEAQERLNNSSGRAAQVFSTQAVNARDLRLNMANLASQMTLLAGASNRALVPLLSISQVVRRISQAVGGTGAVAGGSVGGAAAAGALGGLSTRLLGLGAGLGVGGALAGGLGFGALLREGARAEQQLARIEAVIRATGSAAGLTAQEVRQMAQDLAISTGTSADEIEQAAAKLATFRSIAGDTFREALSLSLDLASTGFGSIQERAVQVGKALEDPIRGFAQLREVGVTVTAEQERLIRTLQQSGDLLGAQGVILDALKGQVEGVGEEIGQTLVGAYDRWFEAIKAIIRTKAEQSQFFDFLRDGFRRAADAAEDYVKRVREAAAPQNRIAAIDAELSSLRSQDDGFGPFSRNQGRIEQLERERARQVERLTEQQLDALDALNKSYEEGEKNRVTSARNTAREVERALDRELKAREEHIQRVQDIARGLEVGEFTPERAQELVEKSVDTYEQATGAARENAKAESERAGAIRESANEEARALEQREKLLLQLRETEEARRQSIDDLEGELRATQLGEQALEEYNTALQIRAEVQEFVNQASEAGKEIEAEAIAQIAERVRKERDLRGELELTQQAQAETEREQQRLREQAEKAASEPYVQAARSIQQAFSDTFRSIFDDGIDSFTSLKDRIFSIFKELAAQIAALKFFNPAFGSILGGLGLGDVAQQLGLGGFSHAVAAANAQQAGFGGDGASSAFGLGGLISRGTSALSGVVGGIPGGSTLLGGFGVGSFGGFLGAAGIGGLAGNLLGLTSGNSLVDLGLTLGGGALGGLAGGALGGALTGATLGIGGTALIGGAGAGLTSGALLGASFGSILPGIGTALGALAGLALGSLFSGLFEEHIDLPEFRLLTAPAGTAPNDRRFAVGGAFETPFGTLGADAPGTSGGDLDVRSLVEVFAKFDETIAQFLSPEQIERAAERLQSTTAFQVLNFGNSPSTVEIIPVLEDRLRNIFIGAFGEETGRDAFKAVQDLARELDDSSTLYIDVLNEQAALFLDARQQLLQQIEAFGADPLTDAAQAIADLRAQAEELTAAAEGLFLAQEDLLKIDDNLQKALEALGAGFASDIRQQILEIQDPVGAAVAAQKAENEERLREAATLLGEGLINTSDYADVLTLNLLLLEKALENASDAAEAAGDSLEDLARPFQDLRSRFTASTQAFVPTEQALSNAFLEFTSTVALAAQGDRDALGQLPSLISNLDELNRSFFGTGEGVGRFQQAILETLNRFADTDFLANITDQVAINADVVTVTATKFAFDDKAGKPLVDFGVSGLQPFSFATGPAPIERSISTSGIESLLRSIGRTNADGFESLRVEMAAMGTQLKKQGDELAKNSDKLARLQAAPK